MTDPDVLVVGGGPAGLAAAARLADAGLSVLLVELRPSLGGAFHRRPNPGVVPVSIGRAGEARWHRLVAGVDRPTIEIRRRSAFLGIDGRGVALIEDRVASRVETPRPRAVVIATGAVEIVRPRPGWELPGVVTAGGLQVMMKETGRPPTGRILVAGNGPLLLAVAGQLAARGNPPAAIVEAGDPTSPAAALAGLGLLAHPRPMIEAAGHMARILARRVPWRRSTEIERIEAVNGGFRVSLRHRSGRCDTLEVDHVALHDGIRPNGFGLPESSVETAARPFVVTAGDCREVLGVVAAEIDGERAAARVIAALTGDAVARTALEAGLGRERRLQAVLARVFAAARPRPAIADLPAETVLCRCEGRTLADLKALFSGDDTPAGREIKLSGRFTMGLCQGRFCAHAVAEAAAELRPEAPAPISTDLTGRRWPARPVAIAALAATPDTPES